jgi:hypothetical protein
MTQPYQATQIVQITDTTDRNAQLKIQGAYTLHKGRNGIHGDVLVVPAADTLDIGAAVSELITNKERPERLIIAVNSAPPDKKDGTKENARRGFYFADLGDGVTVGGTSNGLELAYIRPLVKDLYELTTTNAKGSQFRSLEVLPEASLQFANPEKRAELIADGTLKKVNPDSVIPPVPQQTHVIEVDNFRNAKLWVTEADRAKLEAAAAKKEDVRVTFAQYSVELLAAKLIEKPTLGQENGLTPFNAKATPTLFEAPLGTNLIALRSSSQRVDGGAVPIIATIREHPAKTEPNYPVPRVGAAVTLAFGS